LALSADGATLAVGAPQEDSNATGIGGDQTNDAATDSGAVYVFTRAGGTWSQQAYVKASNTDAMDRFGDSVALSADGSTLAVGAGAEDSVATGVGGDETNNAATNAGAAYVFTRAGTTWSQEAYVKASNTDAADYFGDAIALSANGSTLAAGAGGEDSDAAGIGGDETNNAAEGAGAVYVFTRTGTTWLQQAYIKASNSDAGDYFGIAVAVSSDALTLAIGAAGESSNATGVGGDQSNNAARDAGAVYVFGRVSTTWTQHAYVKASNTDPADGFGSALALAGDGSTISVGAFGEASNATGIGGNQNDNTGLYDGAVYVFTAAGTAWSQQAYVKASNTYFGALFGTSTALTSDGSMLVVGASQELSGATGIGGDETDFSAPRSGAVYVY
jgi:hypothetical protein